jgi:hypothetical protein
MPQPLEVDVVQEGASLIGPILIGLGAVAAAVLTALTANWRHRKQLAHDRELQKKQLEHDRVLRREELEHDREMRKRENARVVLDEVLSNERALRHAANDFFDAVDKAEVEQLRLQKEGADQDSNKLERLHRETLECRMKLHELLADAHYDTVKLLVRMGGHSVVELYEAIADTISERVDALETGERTLRTSQEKEADRQAAKRINDAQVEFLAACVGWHTSS